MVLFKSCFCLEDDDDDNNNNNDIFVQQRGINIQSGTPSSRRSNVIRLEEASSAIKHKNDYGKDDNVVTKSSGIMKSEKQQQQQITIIPEETSLLLYLGLLLMSILLILIFSLITWCIMYSSLSFNTIRLSLVPRTKSLIMYFYHAVEQSATTIVMIEIFVFVPIYFVIKSFNKDKRRNLSSTAAIPREIIETRRIHTTTNDNTDTETVSNSSCDSSCIVSERCTVDLSGEWSLLVDEEFQKEYDEYLTQLGQNRFIRAVALRVIGLTKEVTKQNGNNELYIRSENPKGIWERTLQITSTAHDTKKEPLYVLTADGEKVRSEAWWEKNGTVHHSWLRGGGSKYGGGDFESIRYLQRENKILVCESIFHPSSTNKKPAKVTWKFLRNGETI